MEKITAYLEKLTTSPALTAVSIILLSVLAAWIVGLFINRILRRLASYTRVTFDDRLISAVHRPVFLSIILFGHFQAFRFIEISGNLYKYAHATLFTFLVVIWTFAILRIIHIIVDETMQKVAAREHQSKDVIPLVENVAKVVVVVGAFFLILAIWKVNITPFLASAGLAGVAVAFAAKDTLANFFGGISIFFDRSYKIGDYVILETGERGEVVVIGIRSTRIKTRDDILITIPNSVMANTKIINESAPQRSLRMRIPVGVAYGSDIDSVEDILMAVAASNKKIAEIPAPRVRFRQFGDSALQFELLCWGKQPADKGLLIHELNRSIYKSFRENGIQIPFPQRDIHIRTPDNRNNNIS